ncbi:MAG: RHS repeat-associated core domain-containing protein, partial [Bacteroidota bacterium]
NFTGQRLDAGVGLLYYRARYYDPALGRFIQPDTVVPNPADPQSLNRYAYVHNNPLRYTDPTGHWEEHTGTGRFERPVRFVSPVGGRPQVSGYDYSDSHRAVDIRNPRQDRDCPQCYGVQGREVYAPEDVEIIAIQHTSGWSDFTVEGITYHNPNDYVIKVRMTSLDGMVVEDTFRHTYPRLIDPEGPADDPANWAIQVGDKVGKGTLIGYYAQVGKSTGPHIHWERRVDGSEVNPLEWVPPDGTALHPARYNLPRRYYDPHGDQP